MKLYSDNCKVMLSKINKLESDTHLLEVCPQKQFIRIMFASYLVYALYLYQDQASNYDLLVNVLSFLCCTSTYLMLQLRFSDIHYWAYVHSLNSFMLFNNLLGTVMFIANTNNYSNQVMLRLVNVPTLAVANNVMLTDWELLPKHSQVFVLGSLIYGIVQIQQFSIYNLSMEILLRVAQYFVQMVVCKLQQKFRSRNLILKKPVPLEEAIMNFKPARKK